MHLFLDISLDVNITLDGAYLSVQNMLLCSVTLQVLMYSNKTHFWATVAEEKKWTLMVEVPTPTVMLIASDACILLKSYWNFMILSLKKSQKCLIGLK